MPVERIVSLLPSSTEIVCALGFENRLVGRSHECDFPASVERLPVCTQPKFDPSGTSSEIDSSVQTVLREALSVYQVHADLMKSLRPHLIVTQSQCDVCAVNFRDVERAVSEWLDSSARIVSLEPNTLSDVWDDIGRVAAALEAPKRGSELVREVKRRVQNIAEIARSVPHKPTVACLEWIDPLMATGNWIPELVEAAGATEALGETGRPSRRISWDNLLRADPEAVIVMPCGYGIERSRGEIKTLELDPRWSQLRAVQAGRVYLADGNQYFNRPGPRLVESLEILAEILHPTVFRFGHRNSGWEPR